MRKLLVATMLAASCSALPVQAATIVVGNGDAGNAIPFGGSDGGDKTQYQQVYSSKSFAKPVLIRSISFQRVGGGTTLAESMVKLAVSTTSAAVDGLSTDFTVNIGPNSRTVFSGALQPKLVGNILKFTFSTPFRYVPRNGNLLLDFKFNNYRTPEEAVLFRSNTGNAGGLYSSMHDFGPLNVRARNSSDGFIGNGLVTTFDTAAIGPVPEPGTWAMMILGFGVIGSAMRSARRKQTMRIRFA